MTITKVVQTRNGVPKLHYNRRFEALSNQDYDESVRFVDGRDDHCVGSLRFTYYFMDKSGKQIVRTNAFDRTVDLSTLVSSEIESSIKNILKTEPIKLK